MDNLSIDDLRPGMIVAERVSDPSGRILLEGHTPITPEVIRVLRSWGIQHIPILPQEGVAPTAAQDSGDTPHSEELRAAIEQRFQLTQRDHPVIQAIFTACFEHAIRRAMDE